VSIWIPLYLIFGLLDLRFRVMNNPHIVDQIKRFGEHNIPTFYVIVVLLWPLDALFILFLAFLSVWRFFRYTLAGQAKTVVQGVMCGKCHTIHRWLGDAEKMREQGWTVIREGDRDYWFCPNCDPWEMR
jgi:hypothetical protein